MSFLYEPGELAHTPVAALLLEALNLGATGVLAVRQGGAESRVFLRDGVPVGAQTFAAFKPLGQVLLAARVIDMDALARSLSEMARTGRPQGEVLVAMGVATVEQVERALSEQQAGYLALIAGLGAGAFAFEARPVPEWTRGIRIAPLRAILEALGQPQARELVAAAIEPVSAPVALAPGHSRLAEAFGWTADEAALVARLHTLASIDALSREPGVEPDRARAILAALLLLGLASGPGAAEVTPRDAVKEHAGLGGDLLELELEPAAEEPAAPVPAAAPAPRPVSQESRERRRRLLSRALQNIGTGPLARAAPGAPAPAAAAGDAELRAALAAALPRARDPDLFTRLGVPRTATREEVRSAYFQLAKRLHPDRFAAPGVADLRDKIQDLFAALNEAYEVLSDDRRRAGYLRTLGEGAAVNAMTAAVEFQKAEACQRTRDLKRARGFYESAVRADPRPEYLAALALALATDPTAPDLPRARQLVVQALRDPGCARAAFVAGALARSEGNDVVAERHLRAALALEPGHADAQRELRAIEAKKARRDRPRD